MSVAFKAQLERSLSQSRTLDDSAIISEDEENAHPGHRYFTPQPGRKKPFLPPKPGAPIPRKRRSLPRAVSAEKADEDDEDESTPSPEAQTPQDPDGRAAEDSGPVPADKESRLASLRATSTMEPLMPKRKAPGKPAALARRRTSDTHVHVIEQLKKREQSLKSKDTATLNRRTGKKVQRSASSAGVLSDSSDSHHLRRNHPQFYTPQPTRRKFNLVDRTPSFNDPSPVGPVARLALKRLESKNHGSDASPSPSPNTPVSPRALQPPFKLKKRISPDSGHGSDSSPSPSPQTPVTPLPVPSFKNKKLVSQNSSDSGLNSDISSSPSPLTPVSPLAAPAFSGRTVRQSVRPAPPVPAQQSRQMDFQQWKGHDMIKQWTTPEKSPSLSKDVTRNRPVTMPAGIPRVGRGGSVNKSKQRQSAVRQAAARHTVATSRLPPTPAIARTNSGRQRHQSAPAGRVALALKHDPTIPVTIPTGEEAPLNATLSSGKTGMRRRHTSDSLRKEVLRSVSIDRARHMMHDERDWKKEEITPLSRANEGFKKESITMKSGLDEPDSATRSQNGGTRSSLKRYESKDNESIYSDYPSTFSSPTPSPTRQRPTLRRGRSSRTSLGSLKSMFASNEFLSNVFLTDRKSHRKLKGVVGALAGFVMGGCLFLGLHYGLEYGLIAASVISIVGTLIMCLTLAFTVRARCVAALMVPTLCTSKGRAAFLAIIVALLLVGPIDNIYGNAKEATDSMSCSAELARNQTKLIKDAAKEIFDVYVRGLMQSVRKLQVAAREVQMAFQPVENVLSSFVDIIGDAGESIRVIASRCRKIIQSAHVDCVQGVGKAFRECKRVLGGIPEIGNARVDEICDLINIGNKVCNLLGPAGSVCEAPSVIDTILDEALKSTRKALEDFRKIFDTDVDFTTYWETRTNQSQSLDSIQASIQQELEESFSVLNTAFSVVDKIVALSILFLLFRSYQYHSKYRTKDRFDNFYVTEEFKLLDEKRMKSGRSPLLPLKKSERRRLIDLSSFWLSKPEKGLFRLGLMTVLLHAVIAAVLILADYGLFWLLSLISRHGKFNFEITGGGSTDLTVGGSGILSQLIQTMFVEGFAAASEFNISLDTEHCLPRPNPPNEILAAGIGVLYLVALLMVLSQAYALRLRRYIASYYYPERELQRIHFLYNTTLQRRQSLFKLLKQRIRQTKHEMDVERRVSLVAYLSSKYPCWRKVFRFLGQEKRVCLGCADSDDGTFKSCDNPDCSGLYCRECLHEIENTCSLCHEIVVGSNVSIGIVEHRV